MKTQEIQAFTNRITQSNKSELIVVLYDIFFSYMEEAKSSEPKERQMAYRHASQVLEHLKGALNFKYEVAGQLYSIYDFCERTIAKAMYKDMSKELEGVCGMMTSLKEAFEEVSKQDASDSMIQNAQKVTAGLTYGKNDISESQELDPSRGFLA